MASKERNQPSLIERLKDKLRDLGDEVSGMLEGLLYPTPAPVPVRVRR
jgi:hypothetical protein